MAPRSRRPPDKPNPPRPPTPRLEDDPVLALCVSRWDNELARDRDDRRQRMEARWSVQDAAVAETLHAGFRRSRTHGGIPDSARLLDYEGMVEEERPGQLRDFLQALMGDDLAAAVAA